MSYSESKECHDTLSKPNQRFGNKFSFENLSILIEMNIEHDSSFQWIMHESISSTRRNASCVSTFYQSLSSLSRSVVPSTPTFARSTISALNLATSGGVSLKTLQNFAFLRYLSVFLMRHPAQTQDENAQYDQPSSFQLCVFPFADEILCWCRAEHCQVGRFMRWRPFS